jgi:Radial spokehead-like protein
MELKNIERTGMMSCNGLNLEEISGLEIAMMKRKLEENLPGKMYFWGKIFGTTQDYLIVHNNDPYAAFPEKKYYFW